MRSRFAARAGIEFCLPLLQSLSQFDVALFQLDDRLLEFLGAGRAAQAGLVPCLVPEVP
ncbi:hypothetical protein ACWC2H_37435 [Streptomyces sp. 900105755]